MIRTFLKTFILFAVMFAPQEGFSTQTNLEQLYHERLQKEYMSLQKIQAKAQKYKTAYIVSGILALLLLGVFAYFFKLMGVLVALVMIAAAYFTLKDSAPVVGAYEKAFKQNIISPIAKLSAGYSYREGSLKEEDIKASHLFAARIKRFSSWDLYAKEGVQFSYVHLVFDTKENASVERFAENIFEGYLIMIDKKNDTHGILVSESLRNKVADMDIEMGSFFADAKRGSKQNGFDIYGEVTLEEIDKASKLRHEKIAISYQEDAIYVALFKEGNPFLVDVFKQFDLLKATQYAKSIKEIDAVVEVLK